MKLLKLLEGLYQELKTYNETKAKEEEERKREFPTKQLNEIEILSFKLWINRCLEEKNIVLENLQTDNYCLRVLKNFLESKQKKWAQKDARNLLCAVLGYGSIDELLAAWRKETDAEYRQSKGGEA